MTTRPGGAWAEHAATLAVVMAALAMASAVVYRELGFREAPTRMSTGHQGMRVETWQDVRGVARMVDSTDASVLLIEFTDLECPACRRFHERTLPELKRTLPIPFDLAIVHLPLANHRFSMIAAHAAECAADQGRFAGFVKVAMAKQDSFGLKPWIAYARDAGVPDSVKFLLCMSEPEPPPLVEAGMEVARRLNIHATPTVLVNGWRLPGATAEEIRRVVLEILDGRQPYPTRDR